MRKNIAGSLLVAMAFLSMTLSISATSPTNEYPNKGIRITPPAPVFSDVERQEELAKRRKLVADAMDDNSLLILFSAEPKIYTNDVDYPYRQENNLYYLTALKQNGTSLVIKKENGSISEYVFIPKRNPQFETWNGKMYSNEDAIKLSGLENIVDSANFKGFLDSIRNRAEYKAADGSFENAFIPATIYLLKSDKREYPAEIEFAAGLTGYDVKDGSQIFDRLRSVKSPYEIKMMQHAVDITTEAFGRSMGMAGRAKWEYEVQAEVEYTFRRRNADFWGYPSIVGCGANATTLHYVESQSRIKPGELLLMDVGAEYDHYTADITRDNASLRRIAEPDQTRRTPPDGRRSGIR
ncbi:MAG: aminopeptidase P family protein, partial [Acidobacteria bacterium]|nr:aminopeptidase P family protein [Acidobacteriota bacterium]